MSAVRRGYRVAGMSRAVLTTKLPLQFSGPLGNVTVCYWYPLLCGLRPTVCVLKQRGELDFIVEKEKRP